VAECLEFVQRGGHNIKFLSDEQRTHEVCLEAVKNWGSAIQYLNDTQRTPEVCLEAVKQNGNSIQYLTDEQRTSEVCLEAVKQNNIELVKELLKNTPHREISQKLKISISQITRGSKELKYGIGGKIFPKIFKPTKLEEIIENKIQEIKKLPEISPT
jgi:Fe-S-cluster formation regulator IscX/YfhJ